MLTRSSGTSHGLLAGKKRFLKALVFLLSLGVMSSKPSPYRVLGVSRFVSNDELKRVYRKLMRQYHPDGISRHAARDMGKAHRNALAINAAYDAIMKKRGLKKLAA